MGILHKEEILYRHFLPLNQKLKEYILPYIEDNVFGDTCYNLMYAWKESFAYAYTKIGNNPVVIQKEQGQIGCILYGNIEGYKKTIEKLLQWFEEAQLPLYIKYIKEEDLEQVVQIIQTIDKKVNIIIDEKCSDYIYTTEEFLSMKGKKNKRKRGDLNVLNRTYPDLLVKYYDGTDEKLKEDARKIFEIWCKSHVCENCVMGCEKKACFCFLDHLDLSRARLAVSYTKESPLSFAISEKINQDMDGYYFQKNIQKIRGLTYWLNRQMALEHRNVKYINLGEDLGIKGLQEDKSSFHPIEKKKKYTLEIY